MKKTAIFTLLLACSVSLSAQGIGDWFNQKATQTKLLVQQIAALEIYKSYLKTGYKIANTGLSAISDFKNGEFSLHKTFFSSLKYVNPKIKQYPKITDIIRMQVEILKIYGDSYKIIKNSDAYTPAELNYIREVFTRVLKDCEESVSELIDLVTDGKLEMKDDERMERVDQLYLDVEDMYVFTNQFSTETRQLGATRIHDQQELNIMDKWYYKE